MFDFRLKVFYTVAKRLNFTKAADELCITQPAVSKHIQEIEKVYRGLDGMSLIDLEVLVQAQIESTVEAIYATVTLGNLPIVFTDIIFYALLCFRIVQDRLDTLTKILRRITIVRVIDISQVVG